MKNIIEIKDLTKNYWKNEVLKWVNLEIEDWDFFALLWYNWAGKSTTIKILTNLASKTWGKIFINGLDIDKDFSEARKYIWVVPQEFNFDVFSKVEDVCTLQAGYYWVDRKTALERTEKYLKKLDLWEKRDSRVKQLSGGMKRRLMIARALIHEPKILILDEPTAWVDVELRQTMWEFIKEINKNWTTIILTTHYLEEVEELCKNMAILSGWKIIEQAKVKDIIAKLDEQTYILDLEEKFSNASNEFREKYFLKEIDEKNIEITVKNTVNLNELFELLDKENIKVKSIREKQNRVEALFMKYLKK